MKNLTSKSQHLCVLLACAFALCIAGCAHPIEVSPDIAKIERSADSAPRVHANVGYYISPESKAREVTTNGGGGDRTRYFPYRDIEAAFQKMLSNVFDKVTMLTSPTDPAALGKEEIKYVVSPDIVTTSGSTSFLTWPPTNFTVDLTANVRDSSGKMVASPRVVGNGQAEFSEFKSDHGLAGRLAMQDALLKMQRALLETSYGPIVPIGTRAIPDTDASPKAATISDRLAKLKALLDQGLISPADFDAKKKQILDSL